jgi:hypothetical protein
MRNWIVKFLGTHYAADRTFESRKVALDFFFDDCHSSMDIFSFKTCLSYCDHLETLDIMLRNSRKHYKGLSASARIGLGAETSLSGDTAVVYMAKIGWSIPELAVVQFPEPVDGSALHLVAERLVDYHYGPGLEEFKEGWTQLGVDIIQNGADLFSTKRHREISLTPLLVILNACVWQEVSFSRIRRRLQRWTDMLRRANIDLGWYCAKESET